MISHFVFSNNFFYHFCILYTHKITTRTSCEKCAFMFDFPFNPLPVLVNYFNPIPNLIIIFSSKPCLFMILLRALLDY